jgi:hypothetical protein
MFQGSEASLSERSDDYGGRKNYRRKDESRLAIKQSGLGGLID